MSETEWNPIARTSENRAPSQLLPHVHLLAIIDRSASMAGCEQLTTVALREFFEELKKHRVRYSVRLAEFSADVEIHAPQPLAVCGKRRFLGQIEQNCP